MAADKVVHFGHQVGRTNLDSRFRSSSEDLVDMFSAVLVRCLEVM